MRLAVYTDDEYSDYGGAIHARRAFNLFVGRLADRLDHVVIVGRLREGGELAHYRLPERIEFVALPYYESLAAPLAAIRGMARSLARFWRVLDRVDGCWLLGPHPYSLAFAALAALRGRQVFLGVRQDLPEYARSRHPGRRGVLAAALLLEGAYRALARICPTVVVGPALGRRYAGARRLLEIAVSLVEREHILAVEAANQREYGGELTILSVGRIDEEKNPLMLAEVLARLSAGDPRWRLVVCGEGSLDAKLRARLSELAVDERAELRGYVNQGEEIRELYLSSHVFLNTSRTEGLPQVIIEAFAAGLPVVATDVGGIREALGEAVILVPTEDIEAMASAVGGIVDDAERRRRLIAAGNAYVHEHTLEAEAGRVSNWLSGAG